MHRTEGANAILDSSGHRIYTEGPPPTTITEAAMNAIQEEICTVIENAGFQLKSAANDTYDQLWQAITTVGNPYDYVVYSNPTFLDAIERVAANQYKIKDEYESVHFRSTEYSMSYVLSGDDTWGYIKTNNCKYLNFEMGAFINMGNERGYIEVNTDGCLMQNVSIRGLGTVASAISQSFLLNARNVTYLNCDTQIRLGNATYAGFKGSGTVIHNETSKYIGCLVYDIEVSAAFPLYGFKDTHNMTNCIVDTLNMSGGNVCFGFSACYNISNCIIRTLDGRPNAIADSYNINNCVIKDIDGNIPKAIVNSSYISNCHISDIDATVDAYGLDTCNNVSNCIITDIESTVGLVHGLDACNNVSNCRVTVLDAVTNCYAFYQSNYISSCYVNDIDSTGGNAAGFYDCDNISSSYCVDIDSTVGTHHGFENCSILSSCDADTCEDGYNTCNQIAGCRALNNNNNGYMVCQRISASAATSNGNDGFEDCSIISACISQLNTGNGFDGCKNMTANRANGNTGANYLNSFADWASLNACADTAAGGYNS